MRMRTAVALSVSCLVALGMGVPGPSDAGVRPVLSPDTDLPPPAAETTIRMGARSFRVLVALLENSPEARPGASNRMNVLVSVTPTDNQPLPRNFATPKVTVTYARRSTRVTLQPLATIMDSLVATRGAPYGGEATVPWTPGTRVQVKVELEAGRTKGSGTLDRVLIAGASPTT